MRTFLRTNYRLLLCAFAGILCGFALGYVLRPKLNMDTNIEVKQVDHIGRINVLPDTKITCSYQFSGCDHKISREIDALPYVGQTQEEFISELRDVEIESFSSAAVRLCKLINAPCPEHIMLRADEAGRLNIYQTDAESLEIREIQALPLYTGSYSQEISEELYEGAVFDSINEINEYLENVES